MATSMSFAYSGFLAAARMSEGLVVASWGLYLAILAKSPVSETTVVPDAFNCSKEVAMMVYSCGVGCGCGVVDVDCDDLEFVDDGEKRGR